MIIRLIMMNILSKDHWISIGNNSNQLLSLNQSIGRCKSTYDNISCSSSILSRPKDNSKKDSDDRYERKIICTCIKNLNLSNSKWQLKANSFLSISLRLYFFFSWRFCIILYIYPVLSQSSRKEFFGIMIEIYLLHSSLTNDILYQMIYK